MSTCGRTAGDIYDAANLLAVLLAYKSNVILTSLVKYAILLFSFSSFILPIISVYALSLPAIVFERKLSTLKTFERILSKYCSPVSFGVLTKTVKVFFAFLYSLGFKICHW
jgi:hypothetical protein